MEKYYKIEINYPNENNTWKGWEEYFKDESKFKTLKEAERVVKNIKYQIESYYAVFDQPQLRIAEYTIRYIGE